MFLCCLEALELRPFASLCDSPILPFDNAIIAQIAFTVQGDVKGEFKNFFAPPRSVLPPHSTPASPPLRPRNPRKPLILLTIVGSVPNPMSPILSGNGNRGTGNGDAGWKNFRPRLSCTAPRPFAPFDTSARVGGKAGFSDLVGARVSHPRFQSRDFGRVQFCERETLPTKIFQRCTDEI